MTSLEARAHCFAKVLKDEPESWGKAQADAAAAEAKRLFEAKQIDAGVFAEVLVAVSGNHSATRQKLVSYGFIATKEADSAEKRQIQAAITAMDKADEAALAELDKPKK